MKNPAALLIRGQVMHERQRPVLHRFLYSVFYLRVNLARLDELNTAWFGVDKFRLAMIKTSDYGARDGSDLLTWIRATLKQAGVKADGEVWLQTFPRLFGFVFNPVSFWYCHDQSGALQAVLAEVNNTFGESHRYLLRTDQAITADTVLVSDKNMHVSPFCEVQGHYRFRFRDTDQASFVSLDYFDNQGLLLKTTLGGRAFDMTPSAIRAAIIRQPFLTFGIVAGIHWQALKLWVKGVPWFSKPVTTKIELTVSAAGSGQSGPQNNNDENQTSINQEEPL